MQLVLASMQTLCYMIFDHVCSAIALVARVDSGMVRLILWDLGGQEDLQTLWDKVRLGNFKTPRHRACNKCLLNVFFHCKWMYFNLCLMYMFLLLVTSYIVLCLSCSTILSVMV